MCARAGRPGAERVAMLSNSQAHSWAIQNGIDFDAPPPSPGRFGFGGAKDRYRNHPGRVIRCVDPFSGVVEAFSSPIRYENWLLRRFDPAIVYLNASGDEWSILRRGELLSLSPPLVWAPMSKRGTLELVAEAGRDVPASLSRRLEIVAEAHHMGACIRHGDEVRRSPALLDLLDRVRQLLALHRRDLESEPWRERVLEHVHAARICTRAELIADVQSRFTDCPVQLLDAALFSLRQYLQISFDLEGGVYGAATVISC